MEGTRFTTAKHQAQNSPYPHLLNPKIGGIAFVLDAMGEQFDCLLDVTIFYPTGNPTLWSLLSGQLQRIVVRVQSWSIPEELTQGRCFKDEQNRRKTHEWVKHIWEQKEHQLATLSLQTTPS